MAEFGLTDQLISDRYRVLSPLGEGAMGTVYLAEDMQLRRQVALKVMRKEWLSRPDVRRRLENECRLMAHLGPHTNIVTLFDRLVHDGDTVLVLEFVPGETLADIIERTRSLNSDSESMRKTTPIVAGMTSIVLGPRDAVTIVAQCLDGLGFAHSKGVLHRDIKPANIMVCRDYNGNLQAKVMDFGIGKALHDGADTATDKMTALTHAGGPGPGTPLYMAPEQIDPQRFGSPGPAADLYALGITLYELMTQRAPFEGTHTELLHAHTNVDPPDPRKLAHTIVTPDLQRVMLRALRKEPKARYTTAAEFHSDLVAAVSGGTMLAGTYEPLGIEGSRSGVRKLVISGVLAAGIALLAAGGWHFSRQPVPATEPAPTEAAAGAAKANREQAEQAKAKASTELGSEANSNTGFMEADKAFLEAIRLQEDGQLTQASAAFLNASNKFSELLSKSQHQLSPAPAETPSAFRYVEPAQSPNPPAPVVQAIVPVVTPPPPPRVEPNPPTPALVLADPKPTPTVKPTPPKKTEPKKVEPIAGKTTPSKTDPEVRKAGGFVIGPRKDSAR